MDEAKRELVHNWLLKASHDLAAARVLAQGDQPILDVAIYHCQQAAEKALKGFLVYRDVPIERHTILDSIEKASQIEPCFDTWENTAAHFSPIRLAYRYPGTSEDPDLEQVNEHWT